MKAEIQLRISKRLKEDLSNNDEVREALDKLPQDIAMIAVQVHKLHLTMEEVFADFEERINKIERRLFSVEADNMKFG
jgi:2'-5' RNA ligase